MIRPLAEAVRSKGFPIMVELVTSELKREADVLAVASELATVPEIVAGSVTSHAGDKVGHDPVRVGAAVRARGLTPNVHLTSASQDREGLGKTLHELRALGMFNVFALTGDWPMTGDVTASFDLDTVALIELIASVRAERKAPFHISVAVLPFKYERHACLDEYVRLEQKVAAGADLAITQVGWDARKFAELKKYVDDRGLANPLMGNVHVLSQRAAERTTSGHPSGWWASPELVEDIRKESAGPDRGLGARIDRAAQAVAILKGLGYAGAYISGTHAVEQITRLLARAREFEPRWQECYEQLQYGDRAGFYVEGDNKPAWR
jgi:methylenetetrahydrofolate reductase (NADPH)